MTENSENYLTTINNTDNPENSVNKPHDHKKYFSHKWNKSRRVNDLYI